jgi:ribonuclease-3
MDRKLSQLEERLGYTWKSLALLESAFVHTSWANEQRPKSAPNERLEFLGDAALDLITAEYLMAAMPDVREGPLSQERARLVKTYSLAQRARELGLGQLLLVGKGADYLREVESVLADTLEAVIGAAYMDGGLEAARVVALNAGVLRQT